MIIGYDILSLSAGNTVLDGGDTALQATILKNHFSIESADSFVLADDQAVVDKILDYLIVASANQVIDFENPPYTVVGDVNGQDSWAQTALHVAGSLDVNATNPISGSQDLKYNSSTSGITHYRKIVVSSAGGGYTAKWLFKNSAALGAANEARVAMANSADTDGARAWVCVVKGNGDVVFTDDNGDTTFTGLSSILRKSLFTVKVLSTGTLFFYVDGAFKYQGTVISGNQTIDRWLVSGGANATTNSDTGRWDNFTYAVPTAVIRRKSVLVTPVTDPVEMSETSVLNIQLRLATLANDNVVKTVTLRASTGVVIPETVQTNSSGFSNEAVYKPTKGIGQPTILAFTDEHTQLVSEGDVSIVVSGPDSSDEQQWLESDDIKDETISADKQSFKGQIKNPALTHLFFVKKALQVAQFDASMENINSIVADEKGNIYVNGFDGPGQTNPIVRKLNAQTGATLNTYTIPATEENLANRFDGMAYDGVHLWVAGANHLLKLDLDMTLDTDYTIAADGNLQFVASDGEFIWFQLRGGTDTDKDKIWKLDPTDATPPASAVKIDYRTGDADTTIREIKQVAMDDEYIYIPGTGPSTDWDRLKRSDNSILHRGSGSNGSFGVAIDNRDLTIYVAGGVGVDQDVMTLEVTSPTLSVLANADVVDKNFWDLLFDGTNVWVITAVDSTSTNRQFVRKLKFNPGAGTIDLVQSFDITTTIDPTAMAFDGAYLYVVGFGTTTAKNITKIWVGK